LPDGYPSRYHYQGNWFIQRAIPAADWKRMYSYLSASDDIITSQLPTKISSWSEEGVNLGRERERGGWCKVQ
jgi:hypothetical protein